MKSGGGKLTNWWGLTDVEWGEFGGEAAAEEWWGLTDVEWGEFGGEAAAAAP